MSCKPLEEATSTVAPTVAADVAETSDRGIEQSAENKDAATIALAAAAGVAAGVVGAGAIASGTGDRSKKASSKPHVRGIFKDDEAASIEHKSFDEVDSVLFPTARERRRAAESAAADEIAEANVTSPSYEMHYPGSLFGDVPATAPALTTMEELHTAQKASPVVGVSAVNATSIGRRSRDSGYQPVEGESSVGQRMKKFISGRRSDASSKMPRSPLRSSRTSQDSKHASVSASTTTINPDDEYDSGFVARIPGAFPSFKSSARHSDSEASHRVDQATASQEDSAGSSENDQPPRDRHRRHTILGVIKRIFR
ncbi:hypothetical protein GGF39_002144 [Coemansia sp. RSA 1721]|nr:hypothetical protein GGF39_002144 [Coemansia sp. RSA 1721]